MSASTRPAETTAHANNFDFIRIAAALAVLFSHQHAVVAIAGLLGVFRFRTVSIVVFLLALIWYQIRLGPDLHSDWKLRREMMAYFFVGSALFLLTPHWGKRPLIWLFVTVLAGLGLWLAGFRYLALMVGLPFALIYFGTSSTPVIRRFGRFGDPSYGLYLIAFPVQQTVIQYLWPTLGFKETLFISIAITTALAYLSWHVLEKRALKIKPRKPRTLQPVTETLS